MFEQEEMIDDLQNKLANLHALGKSSLLADELQSHEKAPGARQTEVDAHFVNVVNNSDLESTVL